VVALTDRFGQSCRGRDGMRLLRFQVGTPLGSVTRLGVLGPSGRQVVDLAAAYAFLLWV